MKKWILLSILFVTSIGLLARSAASSRYEQVAWPDEKPVPMGTGFLLRPILEGKTIVVSLWIEEEQEKDRGVFTSLITDGFNAWFEHVAAQIKEQGREEEFADILHYVQRPIAIEVIPEGEADLTVRVWKNFKSLNPHCQNHGSVACYHDKQMEFMKTLKMAEQRPAFIHEIGHALGLADQYHLEMQDSSTLFTSYEIHDEIMKESDKLGCGDVDGIINLIDITLQLQRPNGARWKSFCPDAKETFKNGISSHANRYVYTQNGDEWMLREYEQSEKIAETFLPISDKIVDPFYISRTQKILKWDSAGRPALLQGDLGEYNYKVYGKEENTFQLSVLNNKVLSFYKTFTAKVDALDGEKIYLTKSFSLGKGREGLLICEYGATVRAITYSEYKQGEKKAYFQVSVHFQRGDKNKAKHMVSVGDRDDSVLFAQFNQALERGDMEQFRKMQLDWQARFIDWAENWPKYLGFLSDK